MVKLSHHALRWIYITIGWIAVGIGIIGIITPVLPGTVFLIIAAWAFSKSSERFHNWLYTHKIFGPLIQNWDKYNIIPFWGKFWAIFAMSISLTLMIVMEVTLYGVIPAGILMMTGAIYILTRPSRKPD